MADPITPDHYRAMLILHSLSGLPEDVYVNSWVFRNDGIGSTRQDVHDRIVTSIDEFIGLPAIAGAKIATYLAGTVLGSAEIRTYDLGEPPGNKATGVPPRTPITTLIPDPLVRWGIPITDPLPQEVAMVISWKTALNTARGRGRTYVGPLNLDAVSPGGDPTGAVLPATAFTTALQRGATRLMNRPNLTLTVLGMDGPQPVTDGYVDNAFDTQRRRGNGPTVRMPFPVAL